MTKRPKKQQGPASEYRSGRAVPFVQLPWALIDDPEIDAHAIATYAALKRFSDVGKATGAKVSDGTAAARAGCSARTFRDRRALLKSKGWIEWDGRNGATNMYVVHSSPPETAAPVAEVDAQTTAPDTAAGDTAVRGAEVESTKRGTRHRGKSRRGRRAEPRETTAPAAEVGDQDAETAAGDTAAPATAAPAADNQEVTENTSSSSSSLEGDAHRREEPAAPAGVPNSDEEENGSAIAEQKKTALSAIADVVHEVLVPDRVPDEALRTGLLEAARLVARGHGREWTPRPGRGAIPWPQRPWVFEQALVRVIAKDAKHITDPLGELQRYIRYYGKVAQDEGVPEPAATRVSEAGAAAGPSEQQAEDRRLEAERARIEQLMLQHPDAVHAIESEIDEQLDADPETANNPMLRRAKRKAELHRRVLSELGAMRKAS